MSITPESVQQLLASEDYGDRLRGVNQLRQLEPAAAFPLLVNVVKDQNARVRYSAVSQLDTIGKEDTQVSLKLLRELLHNDPEADVQAAAADALGGLQLKEAFDDLERAYHSTSEWLVQFSIIAALGEMGEPRGFELLQEALASDSNLLQTAAIGALGELQDSRAIPLMAPYANSEDWQIRYRLAQALSNIGGGETRPVLEKLATDEVEQVAQEAQRCLSTIK